MQSSSFAFAPPHLLVNLRPANVSDIYELLDGEDVASNLWTVRVEDGPVLLRKAEGNGCSLG